MRSFHLADHGTTKEGRKARAKVALLSIAVSLFFALAMAPVASAVIQGHSPSPLVLQGHSPIVLLVTDPDGNQIGCTGVPCTSTSSPNFVDSIPADEGPASYDFSTNTITIDSPLTGTWTVTYIGTGPGSFTITATTTPPSGAKTPVTYTLISGTTTADAVGSTSFVVNSDATITTTPLGVPEFPQGVGIMVSALLAALLVLRSRRPVPPRMQS